MDTRERVDGHRRERARMNGYSPRHGILKDRFIPGWLYALALLACSAAVGIAVDLL